MDLIKFIRIFFLVLIIIGVALLVTQKMWVPKVVEMVSKNENKKEIMSPSLDNENELKNWKTYVNTQYGFEFKYPSNWLKFNSAISNEIVVFQFTSENMQDASFNINDVGSTVNLKDWRTLEPSAHYKDIKIGNKNGLENYRLVCDSYDQKVECVLGLGFASDWLLEHGVDITFIIPIDSSGLLLTETSNWAQAEEIYIKFKKDIVTIETVLSTFKFTK